ncbi:MAG: xanthine dehydrogenase small subunit [Pseudomonadota bacterium]
MLSFLLNDREVQLETVGPADTLLDHLRINEGLTGTKEGCAEGDCGACTVLIGRPAATGMAYLPANACIRLMPSLAGCHVVTVEHLAQGGALHPVQEAMVASHGSQCGFCTPGIVMALAALRLSDDAPDRATAEEALQGNLCRCTGYAPILEAAMAPADGACAVRDGADAAARRLSDLPPAPERLESPAGRVYLPRDLQGLSRALVEAPEATLVAGATDIGVWTAKAFRDIAPAIFLGGIADLARIEPVPGGLRIGAAVSYADLLPHIDARHPHLSAYWRRIGGPQIRGAGTIGGNLATASPIGDTPPPFMALDARLILRSAVGTREIALDAFFTGYRQTALAPGEIIEAVLLPDPDPAAFHGAWKISKRRDEDISSLSAAFSLWIEDGRVRKARIAFGGMAATPARAQALESWLTGRAWTLETALAAAAPLAEDFSPISDMRASASYRGLVARNLVVRAWRASTGADDEPLEASHAAG